MTQLSFFKSRRLSLGIVFSSIVAILSALPDTGFAGAAPLPGNGDLSITFSDDGAGGTSLTASGTGNTNFDGSFGNFLGFLPGSGSGDHINDRPIPAGLAGLTFPNTSFSDGLILNWSGIGSGLGDRTLTDFRSSFGIIPSAFGFRLGGGSVIVPASGATVTVVDGSGLIPLPFSTFASVYGMSFPTMDGFTFIFGLPITGPAAAPTGGGGSDTEPTILVTNAGAILSTETTGLNSMDTTLSGVQNAAQNATGDLNNRIFRARGGGGGNNGGNTASNTSTSRYLNFAQNQGIDYRVALGLADGETADVVDTLSGIGAGAGHPLAMAGLPPMTGSVVVAVEGGSGKNPVSEKVVIEDTPDTRFVAYTAFDYGFYDQDNLNRTYRGFESDSYAGSAGLEYKIAPWLNLGGAFTYLENNTRSTANLGTNDLDGQVYSIYATAFHGNTYLDVLYSYGDFENNISRNTLLGRTAYGDTESHSHNIDLNLGHTIEVNERFSFGPSAGLNYTTGEVDGYTERNGGLANLIYPDHDFESMIGRLGGYATFRCETGLGLLTNQLSAGWAHEFNPENGNVTASLETSPFALVTGNSARSIGGYTASEERAHAGTDWLEFGATTRLDIKNTGFNFELGYQGQFFRNNASGHFGSAKVGYEW